MSNKFLFSALAFVLPFFAVLASGPETGRHQTVNAIAYYDPAALAKADDYQRQRCKLDLRYPADKKNFATVVWFHGGGLTGGDRGIPEILNNHGYAVAAVSYRLSPKAKCPAYIEDAAAATAWVLKHIAEYGGDPGKVFISGHSAGGYLVAMVATDKEFLAKYGCAPQQLAGVIPISGQMVTHFTIRSERGLAYHQQVVDRFAPLAHAAKDVPPMLLITGDAGKEMAYREEENALMAATMRTAGNTKLEFYSLPGLDHGTVVAGSEPYLVTFIDRIGKAKDAAVATPAPGRTRPSGA